MNYTRFHLVLQSVFSLYLCKEKKRRPKRSSLSELMTRIELVTPSLPRKCSTAEPHQLTVCCPERTFYIRKRNYLLSELMTRIELVTPSLPRKCSTAEPHQLGELTYRARNENYITRPVVFCQQLFQKVFMKFPGITPSLSDAAAPAMQTAPATADPSDYFCESGSLPYSFSGCDASSPGSLSGTLWQTLALRPLRE